MRGIGRLRRARPAFESRTEVWRQVGLGSEVDRRDAQRARGTFVVLAALIAGVLIVFHHRGDLFPGLGTQVRIATVAPSSSSAGRSRGRSGEASRRRCSAASSPASRARSAS